MDKQQVFKTLSFPKVVVASFGIPSDIMLLGTYRHHDSIGESYANIFNKKMIRTATSCQNSRTAGFVTGRQKD